MTTGIATPTDVPLCIDCDGTLIDTDLLHESLLLLVKQSPLSLLLLPVWLLRGKAYLKLRIAERVRFLWSSLPYCERVLALAADARAAGRTVVLATASPTVWAEGIARQTNAFDAVVGTTAGVNLGGEAKAQRLVAMYGERGYDYAGNGTSDLPVWAHARAAIVKSDRTGLIADTRAITPIAEVIAPRHGGVFPYLKMIRVHQWLKNLLVFVPIAAAHRFGDATGLVAAAIAFCSFSLCASSVYVLNDLFDLESDRQHVRKRRRPIAAGQVPILSALVTAPLLLGGALVLAWQLPAAFLLVLSVYFAMTLAYSLRLKRQVVVDLLMLAALYTMRIVAGAVASKVVPSFWLLAFSIFLFFSLAIVKRYSEMQLAASMNKLQAAGRGYLVADLPVLLALGVSSGIAAALIFALYINDPETRRIHTDTMWLWPVPPMVLYWIARIWMKAHRGEVDDDPVVFAVRDWQSLLTVALIGACFLAAA